MGLKAQITQMDKFGKNMIKIKTRLESLLSVGTIQKQHLEATILQMFEKCAQGDYNPCLNCLPSKPSDKQSLSDQTASPVGLGKTKRQKWYGGSTKELLFLTSTPLVKSGQRCFYSLYVILIMLNPAQSQQIWLGQSVYKQFSTFYTFPIHEVSRGKLERCSVGPPSCLLMYKVSV